MKQRTNSDRRDNERRVENYSVEIDRRISQRRSGTDRRTVLAG